MFSKNNRPPNRFKSYKKTIREGKGKSSTRGVWAPALVRADSSFRIHDEPTTNMLLHEWLVRKDEDQITFSRQYVGDSYTLKESYTDDTEATAVTAASSEDEEENMIQLSVRQRAKALPRGPGGFGGNHVLINRERVKRGIKPLCREKKLDEIAAKQAQKMTMQEQLRHSTLRKTMKSVLESGPCRLLGENICKGKSAQKIHSKMMLNYTQDRNNILDRRFTAFGVGSAKSASGELYIVQLYKG